MSDRTNGRIVALDLARSAALLGMAVFHFTFDLEMFGFVARGTASTGGWAIFARLVAGSFLFLAGVSLALAHVPRFRPRPFLRRLAVIVAAAAGISLLTYLWVPGAFIFFGILHSIALASVIGVAFLRAPAWVLLAVAAAVLAAPQYLRAAVFDAPWLWWVGLATEAPRSLDYEPVMPWLAPFLLGMAAVSLARRWGLLARLSRREGRWTRLLGFPGRHSLWVYLIHQPVLVALVWLAAQVAPPIKLSATPLPFVVSVQEDAGRG